ncbi:DTW domain-containing protein [Vibrio sp. T187]|uniref:tRNA-uridine aminocarboxypropyltransferase n=1 Tax=Vibrio TaxID=662 RepID=UPI0010C9A9B8|nr:MULTISPECIES: DTW domain-containing protein [Vibrio]MBW3698551.1 DTW domain-containing protein [Vibrio sp. T187]
MSHATPCPQCGFQFQCICDHIPCIDSKVEIALLTNSNELTRDTNTGKLLTQTLTECRVYEWQRTAPPQALLDKIAQPNTQAYVVYPSEDSLSIAEAMHHSETQNTRHPLFIILDGTWQEAKKMLNKSPWLQALPSVKLHTEQPSEYQLRRNQDLGHLCTCEVGSLLLQEAGQFAQSKQLDEYFLHYMQVFKADKSGHALAK